MIHNRGQYNLHRIFNPQRIAIIGASENKGSIGNALMMNLIGGGFSGTLLPVNIKYDTIHGYSPIRSVSDTETGVDLAIIVTPIHTVPDIVWECVNKNVGGAIIISSGNRQTGGGPSALDEKIRNIARSGGLRIIGPNCLGIIRPCVNLNASFASEMPVNGNLAFISQSGAICSAILDLAFKEGIGFSHFISIGSMLDVDFGDIIDYLGQDFETKSILLYIENLTNCRKFMSAVRSVSRVKPIIVLKSGRSPAGAKAASVHTGGMGGDDAVYDAAFKRAGIVRVDTIEQLFDCGNFMAKQPRLRGSRLAIITNGGGPGVMAADTLARHGIEPATIDTETVQKLDAILPPFWSRGNPIDILGDASAERFRRVLEVCSSSKNLDSILVIIASQALTVPAEVAQALATMINGCRYPVFTCWMGGKSIGRALEILNKAGIPSYESPERAIRAFLDMYAYSRNLETLMEVPPKLTRCLVFDQARASILFSKSPLQGVLPELDVNAILDAYGLPVTVMDIAGTETQAPRIGVTIQPFISNPDFEIFLGARRDPLFGPVIHFGMGGSFSEFFRDRALGLPPMNRLLAQRLMQETKAYALLMEYRNRHPTDMERLEEMIIRLSQLLIDFPEIVELDMHPIRIKDGRPVVTHAHICVASNKVQSPLHLVISPYPEEYESQMIADDGGRFVIRPVKPEDAPLFTALFNALSPKSIYNRFFGMLKCLKPEMLARFTQIDYDREITLVAIAENEAVVRMLGIATIIGDSDGINGDFAVLIGDPWQSKGIGASLLKNCLLIAEKRGYQSIMGTVFKENRGMLALAKSLGFKMKDDAELGEYELVIDFQQ